MTTELPEEFGTGETAGTVTGTQPSGTLLRETAGGGFVSGVRRFRTAGGNGAHGV
ncbi:MAG: hypothetical protein ACLUSL_04725 [Ruminococcus sp.]